MSTGGFGLRAAFRYTWPSWKKTERYVCDVPKRDHYDNNNIVKDADGNVILVPFKSYGHCGLTRQLMRKKLRKMVHG